MAVLTPAVPLVEMVDAGYAQGGALLLEGVHWAIRPGEHWAVLGPNGAGKSTLLRVACAWCWHTSGVVRRMGAELVDLTSFRARTGWVSPELLSWVRPDELAYETVAAARVNRIGMHRVAGPPLSADHHDAARALLRRMGCEQISDKRLRFLSQGERAQLMIARARATEPVLLVLDEPCAGMDPGVRERFLGWLQGVAADPLSPALVLVTHHLEEVVPGVDRTLILRQGRVLFQGPTEQAVTPERLAEAFGTPAPRLERSGGRWWPLWGRGP